MIKFLLCATLVGTAQAQVIIYTDSYGQPAGAAIYQGNIQPTQQAERNRQYIPPVVQPTTPYPVFIASPSVPSPYYINPQGTRNERK
jgi:hypothetical protein